MQDEPSIYELVRNHNHSDGMQYMRQLLEMEVEMFRDTLEKADNPEVRGKAKLCRTLLQLFS